jgi:hypothetical protein
MSVHVITLCDPRLRLFRSLHLMIGWSPSFLALGVDYLRSVRGQSRYDAGPQAARRQGLGEVERIYRERNPLWTVQTFVILGISVVVILIGAVPDTRWRWPALLLGPVLAVAVVAGVTFLGRVRFTRHRRLSGVSELGLLVYTEDHGSKALTWEDVDSAVRMPGREPPYRFVIVDKDGGRIEFRDIHDGKSLRCSAAVRVAHDRAGVAAAPLERVGLRPAVRGSAAGCAANAGGEFPARCPRIGQYLVVEITTRTADHVWAASRVRTRPWLPPVPWRRVTSTVSGRIAGGAPVADLLAPGTIANAMEHSPYAHTVSMALSSAYRLCTRRPSLEAHRTRGVLI